MEATLASNLFGSVRDDAGIGAIPQDGVDHVASTVFIVDGDISGRTSLERFVKMAGWEVESFASAEDFLSHPHCTLPCCVVLDLALPGLSGLELQKQLAGRADMPFIFVASASSADVPTTVQAMKAGAVEFFIRPVSEGALVPAIRAGIERSRAALRQDAEMRSLRKRYSTLSRREREVMALVVSGRLNKQVGFELGISEVTVKAHRGQVMRKMKAASLPGLVTMATRLGLRHGANHAASWP